MKLLPPDAQEGLRHILTRDYGHILKHPDEKDDANTYPVVINKDGDLAWKEDAFVMYLMTAQLLVIDFAALALDPSKQRLRKHLYKRLGYTLLKYNALWYEEEEK